ncbi:MAG TPA: Na+/H+ antiporter NhaA [Bacteroidia bacterium]|jgi:NhaA family Na+:H+ antiporter|nr:Na+/H+ antiporter NhaA [Bacteroidia bacterium]
MGLSKLFNDFTKSEKTSGMILIICTIASLVLANSSFGSAYAHLVHFEIFSKPIEFWINDGLMTIFFLLVGLEIEREIYVGELADIKKSMLPIIAAIGGMLVPALIHFAFNYNTPTQKGVGIPMATDIAFSLAILSLLGKKVPATLKIFLTALAIIDDLGAILVIALFYSKDFSFIYFATATVLFFSMLILNRLKVYRLWIYLLIGMVMWFCMYRSGIHATITGVLLAFAIPFEKGNSKSISYRLQHRLHLPVAFIILPLFALANTIIVIPASVLSDLSSPNCYGIILGLLVGKPLGIFLFCSIGIMIGWCKLPEGLKKSDLLWTGFLAGIGFTMSIFITLLAFNDPALINASKIAVIIGSLLSAVIGFLGLKFTLKENHLLRD